MTVMRKYESQYESNECQVGYSLARDRDRFRAHPNRNLEQKTAKVAVAAGLIN